MTAKDIQETFMDLLSLIAIFTIILWHYPVIYDSFL